MAHEAVVHEEKLVGVLLLGRFGHAREALYSHERRFHLHGHEFCSRAFAEEGFDALAEVGWLQVEHEAALVVEGKGYFRVGEGHAFDFGEGVGEFGLVRFEELAPGRDVEEEVPHREVGPDRAGGGFLVYDLRTLDVYLCAEFFVLRACAECHLCHGCNGGQCFAAEPHGAQGEEVGGLTDFRCGVAFEGTSRIGGCHALSVVDDLDDRLSRVFEQNLNVRGSGIECIFHELFHYGGGTLYHFACGNLVGYGGRENMDDV